MAALTRCHALPVLQTVSRSQALWMPLHSVIATGPSIASMIAAALNMPEHGHPHIHLQALFDLFEEGRISYEDALRNADSVNDLRLNIKLNSKLYGGVAGIHKGIEHMGLTG